VTCSTQPFLSLSVTTEMVSLYIDALEWSTDSPLNGVLYFLACNRKQYSQQPRNRTGMYKDND
jgi:hypothetical protein